MKSFVKCPACGHQNPLYAMNCAKCHAIFRSRIVNIDLFGQIYQILAEPMSAFKKILFAEHKNFLFFLVLLLALRRYLFGLSVKSLLQIQTSALNSWPGLIKGSVLFLLLFYAFASLHSFLMTRMGSPSRAKDSAALFAYALCPEIFSLLLFFPVEYGLFGDQLFSLRPSPLWVKPEAGYIMLALEAVCLMLSCFYLIVAQYAQTGRRLLSIMSGVLIIVLFVLSSIL